MPAFTTDTDVLVHVYQSVEAVTIGQNSQYATTAHPGTGKTIDGWAWNQRLWPEVNEFESAAYAPSIWDATTTGLDETIIQAGYGDNNDILLLGVEEVNTSGLDIWAPNVQHGYFYVGEEEWFLFSDAYKTEYFTITGVDNGQQVLTLSENIKPTNPIQVRNFTFNPFTGRHNINLDFRKKVEFTTGETTTGLEFLVDTDFSPPQLRLNGMYSTVVGGPVTITSGITSSIEMNALELVGISDGTDNQEFRLTTCPVDPSQPVEVWSWFATTSGEEWNVIEPVQPFTATGMDVKVDRDRGVLSFTEDGLGVVPPAGQRIGVYYTTTVAAMYEPELTQDDVLAYSQGADTNPIQSANSKGFVQLVTRASDPESIVLTSDLVKVNPYIIDIGNNIGDMIATVKDKGGNLLEGLNVDFEILNPQVGSFGGARTTASAITDSVGEATTPYSPPTTALDLGRPTTTITYSGMQTVVDVVGLTPPTSVSGVFIYKVHGNDEVLGIPQSGLNSYYTNFLSEEDITSGIQATQAFEIGHRNVNDLLLPTVYDESDTSTLSVGKKTILLTTRTPTMNPHTGDIEAGIFVPLLPTSMSNVGTTENPTLRLIYDGNLELPGYNNTRSYFVVGDTQTRIQASVASTRSRRVLKSNILELEARIPDTFNGYFFANALNDIPAGLLTNAKNVNLISDSSINATSGVDGYFNSYLEERYYVPASGIHESYLEWFLRTRRGDTVGLNELATTLNDPTLSGLDLTTPTSAPAELPMGFRLKSSGLTVASVLDQVTFFDPNDILPSGHFGL